MNDKTRVLTIYQNNDYRDQLRFYGRTRREVGNTLIDYLLIGIEYRNRGGEDAAPTPCILTPDQEWIELWPDHGTDGGKIYLTPKAGKPTRLYTAAMDIELAAVFFSHALTLGQWEEIPVATEDLPAWIIEDKRHYVPKRVKAAQEAQEAQEAKVKAAAAAPVLEEWPYMANLPPNAYKLSLGSTDPMTLSAGGPPWPAFWYKSEITLNIYPPHGKELTPFRDHYVAVDLETGTAGYGKTKNTAVYMTLVNRAKMLENARFIAIGTDDDLEVEKIDQLLKRGQEWLNDLEVYPVDSTAERVAEAMAKAVSGQ